MEMMAREMMAKPDEENKRQPGKAKKTAAEKAAMVPENVTFDTFKSCDMRVGTVPECEKVAGTDRILRFLIDFGEGKPRQILSGPAKYCDPATLPGT